MRVQAVFSKTYGLESIMEPSTRSEFVQFLNQVMRSRSDKMIAGVCGGLAAHSGVPAWVYRALFVTLAIFFWLGLLAYIALWIFMPVEDVSQSTAPTVAP
jgi:phage shock protein PspC (stress-responsive transcriptional regulator)